MSCSSSIIMLVCHDVQNGISYDFNFVRWPLRLYLCITSMLQTSGSVARPPHLWCMTYTSVKSNCFVRGKALLFPPACNGHFQCTLIQTWKAKYVSDSTVAYDTIHLQSFDESMFIAASSKLIAGILCRACHHVIPSRCPRFFLSTVEEEAMGGDTMQQLMAVLQN